MEAERNERSCGTRRVTCNAAAAAAVQPCVQLTSALAEMRPALAAVWVRAAGGRGI